MAVTVIEITVDDLPGMARQYGEGIIIQDCDMNPYEAANVVNETFMLVLSFPFFCAKK